VGPVAEREHNTLANSYINSQATLPATGGAVSQTTRANLGISVSSLERLIVCHRPQATASDNAAFSLGNRSTAGLTQYQLLINSENYPQRPVLVGDRGAEVYSELLIADHALVRRLPPGCGLEAVLLQQMLREMSVRTHA
jgi:hypothetical protein